MISSDHILLGLIGKPVKHSFSKDFFTKMFKRLRLTNYQYELYELQQIEEFQQLITSHPQLRGLNVTIPYKIAVIPFITELSSEAKRIGAVNTIKIEPNGKLIGYNTDYYGFRKSLGGWLGKARPKKGLVLGTGGASLAVIPALQDLGIEVQLVSRQSTKRSISYEELKTRDLAEYPLIVNTTPLGMAPTMETSPDILYDQINSSHFAFDLVYNPNNTSFMQQVQLQGGKVKNGLEMLESQAEKAWEIWTS